MISLARAKGVNRDENWAGSPFLSPSSSVYHCPHSHPHFHPRWMREIKSSPLCILGLFPGPSMTDPQSINIINATYTHKNKKKSSLINDQNQKP